MSFLEVIAPGPLTTFQDEGRPGYAHTGVGTSGAADRISYAAGNRLVGNINGAASLEITFGGFHARAHGNIMLAITGAIVPIHVNGRQEADYSIIYLKNGDTLTIGRPTIGVRSYLSVRGGFDIQPFLGSASTDTLSELGPFSISSGDVLRIGSRTATWPLIDQLPLRLGLTDPAIVHISFGPRQDWFTSESRGLLLRQTWFVTSDSNRIGVRLEGETPLSYLSDHELPSEGMASGSIQVPPHGKPILFLADHPVTGGYPVIAVISIKDLGTVAQLPPGHRVRFTTSS